MADSTRNRSAERLIDILVELQNYGVVSRHNLMKNTTTLSEQHIVI